MDDTNCQQNLEVFVIGQLCGGQKVTQALTWGAAVCDCTEDGVNHGTAFCRLLHHSITKSRCWAKKNTQHWRNWLGRGQVALSGSYQVAGFAHLQSRQLMSFSF